MMIQLDGKKLFSNDFEGFELRRAPGCCHYNFCQELSFINGPSKIISNKIEQKIELFETLDCDYEATPVPQGFIYQILIFSTWGDAYYVGLNGIEFFGAQGEPIFLTKKSNNFLFC